MSSEVVKGVVSILGDDDVEFWDYGYLDNDYPSKGEERLMSSEFTGTTFSEVAKNFKSKAYNTSEKSEIYIVSIPVSNIGNILI